MTTTQSVAREVLDWFALGQGERCDYCASDTHAGRCHAAVKCGPTCGYCYGRGYKRCSLGTYGEATRCHNHGGRPSGDPRHVERRAERARQRLRAERAKTERAVVRFRAITAVERMALQAWFELGGGAEAFDALHRVCMCGHELKEHRNFGNGNTACYWLNCDCLAWQEA